MSRSTALAAIVVGVVLNNYVYLHDMILGKHEGFIYLGIKSVIGIAIAVVLIIVGVGALVGSAGPAEQG